MISRILSAIRAALTSSVRALFAWGDDVLSMPWHVLQALRTAVYGSPPAGPTIDEVGDAPTSELGPVAKRRAMVERGLLPLDLEPSANGHDPLGEAVKNYARAKPVDRERISLERLSDDQIGWLTTLSESDLEKLAMSHEAHCGRLIRGTRAVTTGVAPCRQDQTYERPRPAAPNVVEAPTFLERLQQRSRVRQPEINDCGLRPAM